MDSVDPVSSSVFSFLVLTFCSGPERCGDLRSDAGAFSCRSLGGCCALSFPPVQALALEVTQSTQTPASFLFFFFKSPIFLSCQVYLSI